MKKNGQKTFVVQEKFVYLHCQYKCIDYPGRIPRGQDHIATAPI